MRDIEKKVRIRQKIKYMQKKLDHAIINNQDCTNELIELSQDFLYYQKQV
jgi:hypothetical protein